MPAHWNDSQPIYWQLKERTVAMILDGTLSEGEALRVLAVYGEAPGARPLAMRREREELGKLFADKILPHRNVEIDVLCHGVTRKRLKDAIRSRRHLLKLRCRHTFSVLIEDEVSDWLQV